MIASYLQKLARNQALDEEDTSRLFDELVKGDVEEVTDAQIGAYLFATGNRTVNSDELVGAAKTLRRHMRAVKVEKFLPGIECLDTCGTGGSGLHRFNTSTASALVVAAAGQPVAKHGNKGATSKSGSADVLQVLGVNIEPSTETLIQSLRETNFCFLFAPAYHTATKRVAGIRRQLGFRTIFNFLGPLVNPIGVCYQLLGISNRQMAPVMAEALLRLGIKRAAVVSGIDGLDEVSLCGETFVYEVQGGALRSYSIFPEQFGIKREDTAKLHETDPKESALRMKAVLSGEEGIYADLVLLNAGTALYICGRAASIEEGISLAREILHSKKAFDILQRVIEITNS